MFLTKESEIISLVSLKLIRVSDSKSLINCGFRVNFWLLFFSSLGLGFGVGVTLSHLIKKFICLSVNGLDERLIIFGVTFTLPSRFDCGLGIKNVDLRWEHHLQYLTQIIETKSIPGKIYGNSGMVHFAEINQASKSMLQHIIRVATPKVVPRHCHR